MNPQESIRRARRALREPVSTEQMEIVVPLTPPSVNHYKRPKAGGGFFLTPEAKTFKAAVASLSRGSVDAKLYYVRVNIYLGKGDRGDGDNFNKCVGDALVNARIIHSDAKIKKWDVEKFRDREEPRTEILIWPWSEAAADQPLPRVPNPIDRYDQATRKIIHADKPGPCKLHGALHCRQCHQIHEMFCPAAEKKPPQSEPAENGASSAAKLIRARIERRIERKR